MGFEKESGKILLGITTQRILSIVMVPVVAWLLGPVDYGVFNIGVSACTLFSVIGGLALEASIAISSSKQQALTRTVCTSLLGIFSGVLFLILLHFSRPYLLKYYSPHAVNAILWMVPFLVPLAVMNTAMQNYLAYLGKFQFIAAGDVAYSVTNYATLIPVYFLFYNDYHSLIIASIVALSMRLFLLFRNSEVMTLLPDSASFTQLLREIWETRHFIKFNFPCNILNTANLQLPPILLHLKYSEDVVGLFSMARNIVSIPATLSSRSLGQVFYPKAAREYREGQGLKTITWQTFIYSCRLTIFPTLFIVSAAGFVLPLLLGERWSGVATYMILLLPMILLSAIQTQIGVGFIFNILNQPLKILWGNVFLFVSRMVPLGFVLVFVSTHPYIPVFVYSVGSGVGYALLLVWIFMTTSISVRRAFFEWAKLFALAVVCVSPMGVSLLSKNPWVLGLLVLISILLYGIGAWFTFLTREDRKVLIARTMTWLRFGKKAGPIFAKTSKE